MHPSSSPSTAEEVRELAKAYLCRTGANPADFARRVGYAYGTVWQFLTGKYRRGVQSKEAAISEAILSFLSTAHASGVDEFTGTLWETGAVNMMRGAFQQLVDRPCILMVYAPPGSGKTDIARALMPHFRSEAVSMFRIYCRAGITPRFLMGRVAAACGTVGTAVHIERTISNLRYDFTGRRVALYFDEAQHLSVDCLEVVRELYDELRWSLCFAGSHQLDRVFSKWAGDLEQLERRITGKLTLPAVSVAEAEGIVRSEIPELSPAKVRKLIEHSHVDIRAEGGTQRYLSMGRLTANISAIQNVAADQAAALEVVQEAS